MRGPTMQQTWKLRPLLGSVLLLALIGPNASATPTIATGSTSFSVASIAVPDARRPGRAFVEATNRSGDALQLSLALSGYPIVDGTGEGTLTKATDLHAPERTVLGDLEQELDMRVEGFLQLLRGEDEDSQREEAVSDFGSFAADDDTVSSAELRNESDPVTPWMDVPVAPNALFPAAFVVEREIKVSKGDTLMDVLLRTGVGRADAHSAITSLRDVFDPRDLRIGQQLTVRLRDLSAPLDAGVSGELVRAAMEAEGLAPVHLTGVILKQSYEKVVGVHRSDSGDFRSREENRQLDIQLGYGEGTIESSLFASGDKIGLPIPAMAQLMEVFSFAVDFQRDIQAGDKYEILYESLMDPLTGERVRTGNVLYASMTLSGDKTRVFRFKPDDKNVDYFDEDGRSVRRALLRTPTDATRISSGFGRRKHPILGYNKMHRGVDFAAPTGTRIYAAGHGTVESIGWVKGYGKYIRLRHNDIYKSAYAHMSRFARGLKRGHRVKQGQVIGYVGSTGRSTGPHLHYEVIKNGRHVNPVRVKLPSGKRLAGDALEAFRIRMIALEAMRDSNREQQIAGQQRNVASR